MLVTGADLFRLKGYLQKEPEGKHNANGRVFLGVT
jgi:hypothetical protein